MSYEERQAFEEYVNLMEKCMNLDVDPRDDFVEYSSGRFSDDNFNKRNGEHPPSMYGCDDIFKSLFENEQISNSLVEKVRDFYRSRRVCLEGGLKEYLKSDQFNEFCGGVPAFNDNWNPENFSLARTAGILLALQCNTILTLSIEHLVDTKVIYINTNELPHHILSNMEEEILKTLELEDTKLAQIVNDLNLFKEIYPENFEEDYFRRRGLELQDDIEIFDFKMFIETALSVTIHDYDVIHFQDGVMSYLSFLSRLDRRMLANYLTAMATYEHFNEFIDFDHIRIFQPILISACFEKFYSEEVDKKYRYTAERFNRSFEVLKTNFPENIRETEYEAFRSNYDSILDYIEENYNPSKIRTEYENLQISPDNFHQNLINIKSHGIPKSVKTYDSLRGEDKDMNGFVRIFLCSIIVHWNKPMVFYFSGQETTYWRHLITERNEHSDENDIERDNSFEILRAQLEQFKDLDPIFQPEAVTCSIEAVMYTYRDYKKWINENKSTVKWQDEILSRLNLDCEKLFFIAFSQHLTCTAYVDKCMVILTLMNCEDFSNAFKCSPESRMNPRKFLY